MSNRIGLSSSSDEKMSNLDWRSGKNKKEKLNLALLDIKKKLPYIKFFGKTVKSNALNYDQLKKYGARDLIKSIDKYVSKLYANQDNFDESNIAYNFFGSKVLIEKYDLERGGDIIVHASMYDDINCSFVIMEKDPSKYPVNYAVNIRELWTNANGEYYDELELPVGVEVEITYNYRKRGGVSTYKYEIRREKIHLEHDINIEYIKNYIETLYSANGADLDKSKLDVVLRKRYNGLKKKYGIDMSDFLFGRGRNPTDGEFKLLVKKIIIELNNKKVYESFVDNATNVERRIKDKQKLKRIKKTILRDPIKSKTSSRKKEGGSAPKPTTTAAMVKEIKKRFGIRFRTVSSHK